MPSAAALHAVIAARYSKNGERERVSIAALRIAELRRLFTARYGRVLPDDDAGRDDALIMAHHLAKRPNPERSIPAWLSLWCPWMPQDEITAFTARIIARPIRWRADNGVAATTHRRRTAPPPHHHHRCHRPDEI